MVAEAWEVEAGGGLEGGEGGGGGGGGGGGKTLMDGSKAKDLKESGTFLDSDK